METKVTRKLILDTETSGLDFEKDRIIEIACLELVDNIFTGKKYHQYFNPENINISPESENIHGLNNEFLREFNSFDHAYIVIVDHKRSYRSPFIALKTLK